MKTHDIQKSLTRSCLRSAFTLMAAGWAFSAMAAENSNAADPTPAVPSAARTLVPGKFGQAVNLVTDSRQVSVSIPDVLKERPALFECWVKLNSLGAHNIIMSVAPKTGKHWEIYTAPGTGLTSVFIPEAGDFVGTIPLQAGQWHYLAFRLDQKSYELFVDGKKSLSRTVAQDLSFDEYPLILGGVMGDSNLRCDGAIDEIVISRRADDLAGVVSDAPVQAAASTLTIFHFDEVTGGGACTPNAVSADSPIQANITDNLTMPIGDRFLDEVEEDARNQSTLHGDVSVELESNVPVRTVVAEPSSAKLAVSESPVISLNGEWLMKGGTAGDAGSFEKVRMTDLESESRPDGSRKVWTARPGSAFRCQRRCRAPW